MISSFSLAETSLYKSIFRREFNGRPCCNDFFFRKSSTDRFLTEIFLRNPELSSNYYSSPTCCYKPQKNTSIHDSDDAPYLQRDVPRYKTKRDKHCSGYSSNFSSSRNNHHDDELHNVDSFKFANDKLGELTGHQVEDVEEEVTGLFLDK